MKKLVEILSQFEVNRRRLNENERTEESIAKCFEPCAKEILSKGYFLINNSIIIDIGSIELYYHEEKGKIKDYIMYHTNDKGSHSIFSKDTGKFPYYKIGAFNFHQSGIDVTFEKEGEYRASFLIRSYRVLHAVDELYKESVYDAHSTHIYDDMFPYGLSFDKENCTKIEWVECEEKDHIEPERKTRLNVAEFEVIGEYKDHRPKTQKRKVDISEEFYNQHKDEYIKENKTLYYKQDMRRWRFRRNGIEEIN